MANLMRRYLLIGVELVEQLSIASMSTQEKLDGGMNKFNQIIAHNNTACTAVVV
jgi:hypothetical protein